MTSLCIVKCALTIGFGVGAVLPGQNQGKRGGADPRVMVVAVGVDHYVGGSSNLGCAGDARLFAERVIASVGTKDVQVRYLIDTGTPGNELPPTDGQILETLFRDIQDLPPRSLLIFYFAGHAVRLESRSTFLPSTLFLLTSGANLGSRGGIDFANSITLDTILGAIKRTPHINFMVFLDCCHSGDLPTLSGTVHETEFAREGIRGFVLASSAYTEVARPSTFVPALFQVWDSAQLTRNDCITPKELETRMRDSVEKLLKVKYPKFDTTKGLGTPTLLVGKGVVQCIGEMAKESCLVYFVLPAKYRPPIIFTFSSRGTLTADGSDDADSTNPAMIVQVPRTGVTVSIDYPDLDHVDTSIDLSAEVLNHGIYVVDLSKSTQTGALRSRAGSYLRAADHGLDWGADGHAVADLYIQAAREARQSVNEEDAIAFGREILLRPVEDPRFKIMRGETVATTEYRTAAEAAADTCVLLGNYSRAVTIYESLAAMQDLDLDSRASESSLIRGLIASRLARDASASRRLGAQLRSMSPDRLSLSLVTAIEAVDRVYVQQFSRDGLTAEVVQNMLDAAKNIDEPNPNSENIFPPRAWRTFPADSTGDQLFANAPLGNPEIRPVSPEGRSLISEAVKILQHSEPELAGAFMVGWKRGALGVVELVGGETGSQVALGWSDLVSPTIGLRLRRLGLKDNEGQQLAETWEVAAILLHHLLHLDHQWNPSNWSAKDGDWACVEAEIDCRVVASLDKSNTAIAYESGIRVPSDVWEGLQLKLKRDLPMCGDSGIKLASFPQTPALGYSEAEHGRPQSSLLDKRAIL